MDTKHGGMKERRYRAAAFISILLAMTFLLAAPSGMGAPMPNPDGTIFMPIQGAYPAGSSFYQASLTADDIDGDGQMEILVGNTNGNLYCFNAKAQPKWIYNVGASIQGAPACYDVNGDKKKEIWVGDMAGRMWGFSCRGRVLSEWGWPRQTPGSTQSVGIFSSPSVGDINNDGAAEIVAGTWGHHLFVWNYAGGLLPGWPYDNKDTFWSSSALADIDRDGAKEIIIGADSTGGSGWPYPPGGLLYAFKYDGSMVPGFPKVTPEVTWSSPGIGDVNNDGILEIFVGTGHYYKMTGRLTGEGHRVYGYNQAGAPLPGWPVVTAGSTFSSPAIGDINGDGVREIVIACNQARGIGDEHLMAIRPNGTYLWDIKTLGGPMMASPCLADINSDGKAEVIIGTAYQMSAYDGPTGRMIWNQTMDNFVITGPVAGDFDGDGIVEVAIGTGDAPGGKPGGSFFVFELEREASGKKGGVQSKIYPWPMFRYDSRHSGTFLTGKEPPPPPPPPPPANFHEYILLMNPGTQVANAEIELMNERAQKKTISWRVNPGSRSTIYINRYMSGCGVSARVTSDVPIICERSMYFIYQGRWKGGTDSVGVQTPSRGWFMAEGCTTDNFETFVLVQNPQKRVIRATMTFMREGAAPLTKPFDIAPESRFTLNLKAIPGMGKVSVSTKVVATGGVICERSMYFNYNGHVGGHNSIGVPSPSNHWYLAEGYTGESYDTYILVQNPGGSTASVVLNLLRKDGKVGKVAFTLAPQSRKTVRVDDVRGFESAEVSTEVIADKGVIAERSMYFNAGGRDGGHESIGVTGPAKRWYLAEGFTGGAFDTYVLIMNPGGSTARVKTTFLKSDGTKRTRMDDIKPHSRFTIHVDAIRGLENADVSTIVEAQGGSRVIAERAMYFVYEGRISDGHDSIGVTAPSTTWYFAEGYTGM